MVSKAEKRVLIQERKAKASKKTVKKETKKETPKKSKLAE
jgi:hypothetical protein